MQPGRNDPCPCGSGKKYKKCCAEKVTTAAHLDVEELFREAHSATNDGDYERALPLALLAWNTGPGNVDVARLICSIYLNLRQWGSALHFLEQYLRKCPNDVRAINNA